MSASLQTVQPTFNAQ